MFSIAAAALSGCVGVPTAVMVASLTGNGVSYLTTGKGLPDHALSAVLEQDCASLRVLQGKSLCHHDVSGSNEGDNPAGELTSAGAERGADEVPSGSGITTARAMGSNQGQSGAAELYLVIGSFRHAANARLQQLRHHALEPRILTNDDSDTRMYRVVIGPLDIRSVQDTREQLVAMGTREIWMLDACKGGVHPSSACIVRSPLAAVSRPIPTT